MLNMDEVNGIKRIAKDGLTIAQIARGLHVDRKTVRKYLGTTLQEPPPSRRGVKRQIFVTHFAT